MKEEKLFSPSIVSNICSSLVVPSVVTAKLCVSPRVNSAEPWVRASNPAGGDLADLRRLSAVGPNAVLENRGTQDRVLHLLEERRELLFPASRLLPKRRQRFQGSPQEPERSPHGVPSFLHKGSFLELRLGKPLIGSRNERSFSNTGIGSFSLPAIFASSLCVNDRLIIGTAASIASSINASSTSLPRLQPS